MTVNELLESLKADEKSLKERIEQVRSELSYLRVCQQGTIAAISFIQRRLQRAPFKPVVAKPVVKTMKASSSTE